MKIYNVLILFVLSVWIMLEGFMYEPKDIVMGSIGACVFFWALIELGRS